MLRVLHVVGARPNFMKVAPLMREFARRYQGVEQVLVHTGQHYDRAMSRVFFEELDLPEPDVDLAVGSGSHAWQTAQVMMRFEPVLAQFQPDWVVVPGGVNSTLACALVCAKAGFRIAHIEAGLRSFDRTMPEEVNRILTDHLSDLLLTPSADADENLRGEGISSEKIRLVGNIMIDTLVNLRAKAARRWPGLRRRFGVESKRFILATLHRPSNVDEAGRLSELVGAFGVLSREIPVLFPVHPRARQKLAECGTEVPAGVLLTEPLGYLEFLALQARAALVVTDSGGIQEETTYLGVRCLTLRPNTERPITITQGTNRLVDGGGERVVEAALEELNNCHGGHSQPPPLWDGATAARTAAEIFARGSSARPGKAVPQRVKTAVA